MLSLKRILNLLIKWGDKINCLGQIYVSARYFITYIREPKENNYKFVVQKAVISILIVTNYCC